MQRMGGWDPIEGVNKVRMRMAKISEQMSFSRRRVRKWEETHSEQAQSLQKSEKKIKEKNSDQPPSFQKNMRMRMAKFSDQLPFIKRKELSKTTKKEVVDTTKPNIDVVDKDDKIFVAIDMPGVEKKNIFVHIKSDILEISAEKKKDENSKSWGYIKRERASTNYYRNILLPIDVDGDKVDATFKDGVLSIEMPKIEGRSRKKIRVK